MINWEKNFEFFFFLVRGTGNNRKGKVGSTTHQKNILRNVLASISGRFTSTLLTQTNEGKGNVAHWYWYFSERLIDNTFLYLR